MGWKDRFNTARRQTEVAAHVLYRGAQAGATRAYEGAKVAHSKYNAYQEEAHKRKLEALDKQYAEVRRKQRVVKAEANIKKYELQKKQYGATGNARLQEKRISNNMDRQGGYQGGYKQYGGEAPLFARPKYNKEWWE